MIIAMISGGMLVLIGWYALRATSLPAFSSSMVTRALSTAGSLMVLAVTATLAFFWLRDARPEGRNKPGERPRWRYILTEGVCAMAPAGIVLTSIGIPLASTRLYLDGIQVDQGFRTQFLSRMVQTASNSDMAYVDMPSYYPSGWFWLGGRFGALLGLPGWEAYQPWALVSLAMAASALTPIWRKLTGSLPVAVAIALTTTAIVLRLVPEEPYAAVVAMLAPAIAIIATYAFRGHWASTIAVMIYLGVSACFYTLYTGVMALTMVVYAFIVFFSRDRSWRPVIHLAVMGVGSILIALLAWGPYLIKAATFDGVLSSTAQHFLPREGTVFPMPIFQLSLLGILTFVGLIYIIARFSTPKIGALGIATGVCYVWCIGSMVVTVVGTTLLGFRVEVLISLLLATAGILAIADLRLTGFDYLYPGALDKKGERTVSAVFIVVLAFAGLAYVQQIPAENEKYIDQAYADTDGYGERADRRAPDAAKYYGAIDEFLRSHGREPADTVVMTDEINFMSYYPYYAFNAFTSHYANPMGEFEERNKVIEAWGNGSFNELKDPEAFLKAVESSPWRAPDAFIFRGNENAENVNDQQWKTHVAHDIYPNQPNVRYDALYFNPEAFDSKAWDVKQFGPLVVVVRAS
ncbi:galactan 5-O-arabinofuranosyltransferase [Corynebacterium aquatimens]